MCGVIGVIGLPDSARLASVGLHALQHRGQESAGIVASHHGEVAIQRHMGQVVEIFRDEILQHLPGDLSIGHVRYSTTGGTRLRNAQPICLDTAVGSLAVAHNGNLTNSRLLKRQLSAQGALYSSGTDTEVILHMLARQVSGTLAERLLRVMPQLEGSYSLTVTDGKELVAARDPFGWRPLVLGKRTTKDGTAWIAASETPAIHLMGAEVVREVEPGEVVTLTADGPISQRISVLPERRACVFEHVYFARPDSQVFGQSVYETRKRFGARLADEQPAPGAEVVLPVPDSGVAAALGYARQSGIPYELGLIRSHYVGRTFIQPTAALRETGVRRKLSPVRDVIAGKSLVVVDDSIVRGTTSRQILALLREAGAREIHLRISSPPVQWPCWYGIDTPDRDQLLAAQLDNKQIADFLGADSVGYLTPEGLLQAAGPGGWCTACFTGQYPQLLQP